MRAGMLSPTSALLLTLLLLTLAPDGVSSQERPPDGYRQGFWYGGGGAVASAQIDCGHCDTPDAKDPWHGGVGMGAYGAVGGTLSSRLLMGGEISLFSKDSPTSERSASLTTLTLVVQYYPLQSSRLYMKGGIGLGHYHLVSGYYLHSFMGRTASSVDNQGLALQAGAGYDVLLRSRLALVPYVSFIRIHAGGEPEGPSRPRFLQAGLALHRY